MKKPNKGKMTHKMGNGMMMKDSEMKKMMSKKSSMKSKKK